MTKPVAAASSGIAVGEIDAVLHHAGKQTPFEHALATSAIFLVAPLPRCM